MAFAPRIAAKLPCHDASALTERRGSPLVGVFYCHLVRHGAYRRAAVSGAGGRRIGALPHSRCYLSCRLVTSIRYSTDIVPLLKSSLFEKNFGLLSCP